MAIIVRLSIGWGWISWGNHGTVEFFHSLDAGSRYHKEMMSDKTLHSTDSADVSSGFEY